MREGNPSPQLEIQLDDAMAGGHFSNLAMINHNASEFVLDFIYVQPNAPKGKVVSRLILTPDHIKRFQEALADNLKKFETRFGVIEPRNETYPDVKWDKA
jgi:hypothetical protein